MQSTHDGRNGEAPAVLIENAEVVLPEGIEAGGSVLLRGGRIEALGPARAPQGPCERIDASGLLLFPGILDLHSDAIEKAIRPRPGGSFETALALVELDKTLAACGVTTMYHCLCFGESETNELRTAEGAGRTLETLRSLAGELSVRNRVHIRYEVTDTSCIPLLRTLLAGGEADLFSIMDHTPGQGQFTDLEHFKTYYGQAEHMSHDAAARLAEERLRTRASIGEDHIRELCGLAAGRSIPIASHDDDNPEKVGRGSRLGVTISEFPVRLDAARAARGCGMDVLMGAPNVLRGGSLTGNLGGREAIRAGACTLLGSDYAPMSLLHAVFALARDRVLPLHEAAKLVTLNPARAIGAGDRLGRIAEGCEADLVLVEPSGPVPRVVGTFVAGRQIFRAARRDNLPFRPSAEETRHAHAEVLCPDPA